VTRLRLVRQTAIYCAATTENLGTYVSVLNPVPFTLKCLPFLVFVFLFLLFSHHIPSQSCEDDLAVLSFSLTTLSDTDR